MADQYSGGRPDISSDEVRVSLPYQREPYWALLSYCRHLGYRKRKGRPGFWVARFRTKDKRYRERCLGLAEDGSLPYAKAVMAARDWFSLSKNRRLAAEAYPVGARKDLIVCPIGSVYTIGHALKDYIEWKRIAAAPSTFVINVCLINSHMIPRLSDIALKDFNGLHFRQFATAVLETPPKCGSLPIGPRKPISQHDTESLRKRKKTLNTLVSILRIAFQMAWENGLVQSDRAWRCLKRVPNVDRPRVLHLTRSECRDLLDHCRPDLRWLVLGALYTGCRAAELISLAVEDVARDGYGVYIAPSKQYQPRFVFLPDEGMTFFLRLCRDRKPRETLFLRKDGRPWPGRHYRDVFKAAVRMADLPEEFTFHGLRHTYASQLVQAGTPLSVVAEQLGHADTTTVTRTYGHFAPQIRESEVRFRFSPLDRDNSKRAEDDAQTLENLRTRLHGTDWRGYARINPVGSWPRKNMFRSGGELVAVLREEEERRT
jgi:integrase